MDSLKYESYTKEEHKHWIIFVHGAGGSSKTFARQIGAFKNHFNLLLPDLRHHGKSSDLFYEGMDDFSLELVAQDVLNLMDKLGIKEANFIGVSLGAIVVRIIEKLRPNCVTSIVLGGGVLKLNQRTHIMFRTGILLSRIIPHHTLYKFVAHILMPYENHAVARRMFIREAGNIKQEAFKLWLSIVAEVKKSLDIMFNEPLSSPTLMIMGSQDFAFKNEIMQYCQKFPAAHLSVIPSCGHVCNIEQADQFNQLSLQFLLKPDFRNDVL